MFYNVIDMALINSWIFCKHFCNSSISRRMFIERVSDELTGGTPNKRLQTESNAAVAECAPTSKKRKTCCGKGCRNRATDICVICKKLYVVNVRLNNVKLAPHKNVYFPLVCLSFNCCLFCFAWFFNNITQFVIFHLN